VYLGEDGPTHQPVEHYWALRAIPNLDVVRPADALECAAAWTHALSRREGPTAFALTRQTVPNLKRPSAFAPGDMLRGAYLVSDCDGTPDAVVIATGSEVHVAIAAQSLVAAQSLMGAKKLRVVSAPCLEAFARQDQAYRDALLPPGVPRCSLEVGITAPWRAIVGLDGLTLGHDDFGHSAPYEEIQAQLGLTPQAVADRIASWLG
jgi:transketolase